MSNKILGYKILLTDEKNDYLWANEVSCLATAFTELGFQKYHDEEQFCYMLKKKELFFERKGRKFSLFGEGSWCRYSEFEDVTNAKGELQYVVDYRRGMQGENKKFRCKNKPTNFEIEQICEEYFGLVKSVQVIGNEYHFFFEAYDDSDKNAKALIELVASCKSYTLGNNTGRAIVCTLKDRTEEKYGENHSLSLSKKISNACRAVRTRANKMGYGRIITNPYADAYFLSGAEAPNEFS